MNILYRIVLVCWVVLGVSACAELEVGEPHGELGAESQALSDGSGCEGLLNALDNCPNERACEVLQGLIDRHGCGAGPGDCPCAEAPYPVGQIYCNGDGDPVTGVFFCWSGVYPPMPDHCEVFGGDYTLEEQLAICDACRVAYPDEYAGCVAAGG
jgi:hypothetical protein